MVPINTPDTVEPSPMTGTKEKFLRIAEKYFERARKVTPSLQGVVLVPNELRVFARLIDNKWYYAPIASYQPNFRTAPDIKKSAAIMPDGTAHVVNTALQGGYIETKSMRTISGQKYPLTEKLEDTLEGATIDLKNDYGGGLLTGDCREFSFDEKLSSKERKDIVQDLESRFAFSVEAK